MSFQNNDESYIHPQYTILQPINNDISANLFKELQIYLYKHPDFLKTKSHLEFLRYCFDYYINCDPASRDLPIQEKLKQAGEMARNFMDIVIDEEDNNRIKEQSLILKVGDNRKKNGKLSRLVKP